MFHLSTAKIKYGDGKKIAANTFVVKAWRENFTGN
jgi:hypothetical protein